MLSKTNKLEQLKSQINFLYNSLYSTTDKINSIYEDIKIDQKIIESSVNTYSIWKDKVVYEFIQQRIKHINRQVMLENEYINIKLRCEIDYINQTKQSRFIQLMSRCFDDIYNLFRMNSFDQYKSSSAKDYNSGESNQHPSLIIYRWRNSRRRRVIEISSRSLNSNWWASEAKALI